MSGRRQIERLLAERMGRDEGEQTQGRKDKRKQDKKDDVVRQHGRDRRFDAPTND